MDEDNEFNVSDIVYAAINKEPVQLAQAFDSVIRGRIQPALDEIADSVEFGFDAEEVEEGYAAVQRDRQKVDYSTRKQDREERKKLKQQMKRKRRGMNEELED